MLPLRSPGKSDAARCGCARGKGGVRPVRHGSKDLAPVEWVIPDGHRHALDQAGPDWCDPSRRAGVHRAVWLRRAPVQTRLGHRSARRGAETCGRVAISEGPQFALADVWRSRAGSPPTRTTRTAHRASAGRGGSVARPGQGGGVIVQSDHYHGGRRHDLGGRVRRVPGSTCSTDRRASDAIASERTGTLYSGLPSEAPDCCRNQSTTTREQVRTAKFACCGRPRTGRQRVATDASTLGARRRCSGRAPGSSPGLARGDQTDARCSTRRAGDDRGGARWGAHSRPARLPGTRSRTRNDAQAPARSKPTAEGHGPRRVSGQLGPSRSRESR